MAVGRVQEVPGPVGALGRSLGTQPGTAVSTIDVDIRSHWNIRNTAGTYCGFACLNMKRFY